MEKFTHGEQVFVRGRKATFTGIYHSGFTATVRFEGEQAPKVVPLHRIARSAEESLRRALLPYPSEQPGRSEQ